MKREINNSHDVNAVAIYRDVIVGHIPFNLAPRLSTFMRSKSVCRSCRNQSEQGSRLYGLEVPYTYRLYGPKVYIDRMVDSLLAAGLT